MILKIHEAPEKRKIVVVCDSDLIGKKFEQGKAVLDLSSKYYGGKEQDIETVKKSFDTAYIVSMVGKESVQLGIKERIIKKENVVNVANVPYAQVILF